MSLAFLSNNTLISGACQYIQFWNLTNGKELNAIDINHIWYIYSLEVLSDTFNLVSASDNEITIWNLSNFKRIKTIVATDQSNMITCVIQFKNSLLISGSTNSNISIWNIIDGELVNTLSGHTSTVMCLALLSNEFASGSEDTSIRLWTNNGQLIRILNGHTDTIWSLAVLNNNEGSVKS